MSLLNKAIVINAGALASALIGTIQTVILTRILGPQGIGQYALSVSVLSLSAAIFAFGFPLSFLFYAKQEPSLKSEYLINAFWILLSIGLIAGSVLSVIFHVCNEYFGTYSLTTILILVFYLSFVLLRLLFRNCLMVDIQAKSISLVELSASFGSLLFIVVVWSFDRLTVDIALISFFLAASLRAFLGWIWIRSDLKLSIKPSYEKSIKLSKMGIKQLWPDLVVIANDQIGILMLKLLLEDFNLVGYYSRAVSISMMLILMSQAVMPVLFSRWAGLAEENVCHQAEKTLRFVFSFSAILLLFLLIFANWLILILYGKAFLAAATPTRVLAFGVACGMINRTFLQLLGGRGIPEKGTYVLSVGTIVTTLGAMILIPKWGIIGCSIATAFGQFLMMVILFLYSRKKFSIQLKNCTLLQRSDFSNVMLSLRTY